MKVAITIGNLGKIKPYQDAVEKTGLDAVVNPPSLDGLDGLLLAGGADVNPALYHEERHPETEEPEPERDALETKLLSEALDRDLPVLGICRGNQFLNVAFGGKLIQHLPNTTLHTQRHTDYAHDVAILPDTLLETIVGSGMMAVNSRHHQGVDIPAHGLRAAAVSPSDNLVEALEVPGKRFVLAVQWHPEDRFEHERDRSIFEAFAQAVRRCPPPPKP